MFPRRDSVSQTSATGDLAPPSSHSNNPELHSRYRSTEQIYGLGEPVVGSDGLKYVVNEAAEARLRWKLDLMLMPLVCLIYLLAFIDRSNIGNARIAHLEDELHLKGNDFNAALSIFYISYIVFEIPSNLACKWIGPGWFIPAVTVAFGITTTCTAFVTDFATLSGVRFLLGIFESGMMPCITYYLSRWYRRSELTFRLSLFLVTAALAGAFGGLLASAILELDHFGSVKGWRMIFAIEGIATTGVGVLSFFLLTDSPSTAIWLSDAEKRLCIERLKSERIATTEVVDEFNWTKFKLGLFNPVVLPTALIFLLDTITVQGLAFFLPTIVRTIYSHKSVRDQQLLTVPPFAFGTVTCILFCYVSWKVDRRGIFMIICAPLSIVGYALLVASTNPTMSYAAAFLPFFGIFAYAALTNAQASANVISDTARSASIGMNAMFCNFGGLISTWTYLRSDQPRYFIGHGLNLAVQCAILIVATLLFFWIRADNRKREKRDAETELVGMSAREIQDLDWKNPKFRWHN